MKSLDPQFASQFSGNHFLAPGGWATLYNVTNVTPINSAGYTGTGKHLGIAGQTYFPQEDIPSAASLLIKSACVAHHQNLRLLLVQVLVGHPQKIGRGTFSTPARYCSRKSFAFLANQQSAISVSSSRAGDMVGKCSNHNW